VRPIAAPIIPAKERVARAPVWTRGRIPLSSLEAGRGVHDAVAATPISKSLCRRMRKSWDENVEVCDCGGVSYMS
jgi:hypothetical protein